MDYLGLRTLTILKKALENIEAMGGTAPDLEDLPPKDPKTFEMLMAGATAVGVGTAVYYRGVEAFTQILSEMTTWLADHGHTSLDDLRGLAHRTPRYEIEATPAPVPSIGNYHG